MVYESPAFPIWEQWYEFAQQRYIGPTTNGIPEWVALYSDPIVGFDHRPNIAVSWLWWAFWLLPLDRARACSFHEAIKKHFLVRGPCWCPAPQCQELSYLNAKRTV